MSLKDKVVMITGSTGGLGSAVIEAYLKAGSKLVITYSGKNSLAKLSSEITGHPNTYDIRADLGDEQQVISLFKEIKERFKRLDVVCHLAGGFWMGENIAETPLDQWQQMIRMNLTTSFLVIKGALQIMQTQKSGSIITVASKTALELPAGMGAYSVSKAALLALTELSAKEAKPYHVAVNAILPGIIDTPDNRDVMPDADFKDWVTPAEIAKVLIDLSESDSVSGTHIKMYGSAV